MSFSDIMIYDLMTKKYRASSGNVIFSEGGNYELPINRETDIIQFIPYLNGDVSFVVAKKQIGGGLDYKIYYDNTLIKSEENLGPRNDIKASINVLAGHFYRLTLTTSQPNVSVQTAAVNGEIVINNEPYYTASTCF